MVSCTRGGVPLPDHLTSRPEHRLELDGDRPLLADLARDANISAHRAEIAPVRDHAARVVTLSGLDAVGTWNQLEDALIDATRAGCGTCSLCRVGTPRPANDRSGFRQESIE